MVTGSNLTIPVLVLNRNYMAIHMVTCRRAMCLLYKNTAEVVHVVAGNYNSHGFTDWVIKSAGRFQECGNGRFGDDDWIYSVTYPVRVPRIIRLLHFDRYLKRKVPLTRRNVFARDSYTCQYCGAHRPHAILTIDHVTPRSRGGRESWDNVVTACARCNHKKGMRVPSQAGMKLSRNPAAPVLYPVLEMNLSDRRFSSWRKFV